jgi:hypothetical protein
MTKDLYAVWAEKRENSDEHKLWFPPKGTPPPTEEQAALAQEWARTGAELRNSQGELWWVTGVTDDDQLLVFRHGMTYELHPAKVSQTAALPKNGWRLTGHMYNRKPPA